MKALYGLAAVALGLLSACGEKPQTLGVGKAHAAPAFEGTGSAFTAPGWKPGDKTSWEQELRTRAQNGQNEYNKIK